VRRSSFEALEGRRLLSATAAAEVVGRHIFYNNSAFDGGSVAADPADDAAVATDKAALLPGGRASFDNYTSYVRGINGVMVDVSSLPAGGAESIGPEDLEFRAGRGADPQSWAEAPAPASLTVRTPEVQPGGADAPTRVTVTWADRAIRNEWLQVTVKATPRTGLASDDVFFFGNLVGDAGAGVAGQVSSRDIAAAADALTTSSAVDGPYDFDRSGVVDTADVIAARRNLYRRLRLPDSFTGAGMGLSATYFDDPDFGGVTSRRADGTVDFDWGAGSPAPDIEPYLYSVRWEGQVRPEHSETYTFHTTSNDGVRLWVDGQLLVDHWTNHAATQDSGQVELEAGRKADLRLEYYQHLGTAQIRLEWSSANHAREVVPTSRLYPAAPRAVEPWVDDAANPAPPPVAGDWRMIFRDEFDAPDLDPVWRTAQYWNDDHTVVPGELQAYDASGVSVSGGMLHLTARPDTKYGTPYVSGLVHTGGRDGDAAAPKFSFRYGYLEIRAKLPAGQGLFPAVWMLPASYHDDNGELDVLEAIGSAPTAANFVLHRNGLDDGHEWIAANLSRTFHTFGVDWQPDHVTWYVDGVERARSTDPALICPEAMYPILNVAVGGDWAGAPDETTMFPASMDVEFVRVWQQDPAAGQ
jgi:beta-glucanase (GH16 family)